MCHTAAAVRLSLFRGGARLLQVLPIVQSLVHEAGQTNSLQVCMSKTFIWLTHMHQVPSIRMQQLHRNASNHCVDATEQHTE